VHRRTFAEIQHPVLQSSSIDRFAHQSAAGVDLTDNLSLSDTPNRWIAAHLPHGVQVRRQEGDAGSSASGGSGGFCAGMASTDHDDVITISASSFWDHGILKIRNAPTPPSHPCGKR
jgi:hypothetical protein